VIELTATKVAASFPEYLAKVQQGETIRVFENGRPIAKIIPEVQFMSGKDAAALFKGMTPDPETADAIEAELKKLKAEADNALDH
jgi:antitoxin (DNA-binding transcriptional repressor) of toxin-antitoxin stability system